MKISINSGHTLSGSGTGAVGVRNESVENRVVTEKLIQVLRSKGHTVYNHSVDNANTNTQYLKAVVDKVNGSNAELFISIHFNALNGSAKGTEVFTYKGETHPEAVRIVNNLSALGFKNRGVKDGSHLYVIKNTRVKAILIEICFIDNIDDMNLYLKDIDAVVNAIASGITNDTIYFESVPSYLSEFEEAKNKMVALGVTDGSRPKDNVTREEVWTMLHRLYTK